MLAAAADPRVKAVFLADPVDSTVWAPEACLGCVSVNLMHSLHAWILLLRPVTRRGLVVRDVIKSRFAWFPHAASCRLVHVERLPCM